MKLIIIHSGYHKGGSFSLFCARPPCQKLQPQSRSTIYRVQCHSVSHSSLVHSEHALEQRMGIMNHTQAAVLSNKAGTTNRCKNTLSNSSPKQTHTSPEELASLPRNLRSSSADITSPCPGPLPRRILPGPPSQFLILQVPASSGQICARPRDLNFGPSGPLT